MIGGPEDPDDEGGEAEDDASSEGFDGPPDGAASEGNDEAEEGADAQSGGGGQGSGGGSGQGDQGLEPFGDFDDPDDLPGPPNVGLDEPDLSYDAFDDYEFEDEDDADDQDGRDLDLGAGVEAYAEGQYQDDQGDTAGGEDGDGDDNGDGDGDHDDDIESFFASLEDFNEIDFGGTTVSIDIEPFGDEKSFSISFTFN